MDDGVLDGRMMRAVRLATVALSIGLFCAAVAGAQASARPSRPWFADVAGAATFGHTTGGSVGIEAGYRVAAPLDLVVEAGRMFDVSTSDLDARAQRIASVLGASADPEYRTTYLDAGVRVRPFAERRRVQPYGVVGVGAARVTTATSFARNGVDVSPAASFVQLGPDLTGTITKPYLTAGAGATFSVGPRYATDASYRYGRIFARTSAIDDDTAINTNRVRLGAAVRF